MRGARRRLGTTNWTWHSASDARNRRSPRSRRAGRHRSRAFKEAIARELGVQTWEVGQ